MNIEKIQKKSGIVGRSDSIRQVLEMVAQVAPVDISVLITGESGTGKELVARAIHQLSKRKSNAFVTVNCGALPDTLLESELFGYKKGAFTDAYQDTAGLVEEAEEGTLFLDEIGEISSVVQVKLLRFLQNKEYKQLGSPKVKKANVRIVCATNRDLKKMVLENHFREDLFYRLNIIPINVPALRERKTDIPLLSNYFLARYSQEYNRELKGFSSEVIQYFMDHDWPGNIRELENKIQQMVVLCQSNQIRLTDTRNDFNANATEIKMPLHHFKSEKQRVVDNFERSYIQRMLKMTQGNLSEAAKRAGMDRKNFWQKVQRHNVMKITSSNRS